MYFSLTLQITFSLLIKPNLKQHQKYFKTSFVNLLVSILQFYQYQTAAHHGRKCNYFEKFYEGKASGT